MLKHVCQRWRKSWLMNWVTAEERDQLLPSGRQKILHNRIHWSKLYMAKAGLIDLPQRGRFVASQKGRDLLARNPEKINLEMLLEPFISRMVSGQDRIGCEVYNSL